MRVNVGMGFAKRIVVAVVVLLALAQVVAPAHAGIIKKGLGVAVGAAIVKGSPWAIKAIKEAAKDPKRREAVIAHAKTFAEKHPKLAEKTREFVERFEKSKLDDLVPEYKGIGLTRSQLQHGFKHAEDFGVVGNANNKTLSEFSAAIQNHVGASSTRVIQGTYRGQPVTHFVDPNTGLNVIRDASGNFLSGWKLSPQQLEHVLTSGKLGGG